MSDTPQTFPSEPIDTSSAQSQPAPVVPAETAAVVAAATGTAPDIAPDAAPDVATRELAPVSVPEPTPVSAPEDVADGLADPASGLPLSAPSTQEAPAADTPTAQAAAPGTDAANARPPRPTVPELSPAACAALLAERFPLLFPAQGSTPGPVLPIKLRVQTDIQQRAPGVFTKKSLSIFLHRHTTSTPYIRALLAAPHRFDLDGQPAGEITEEHRIAAALELDRRRAIVAERRAAERQGQRPPRPGRPPRPQPGQPTPEAGAQGALGALGADGAEPTVTQAMAGAPAPGPRPPRRDRPPRHGIEGQDGSQRPPRPPQADRGPQQQRPQAQPRDPRPPRPQRPQRPQGAPGADRGEHNDRPPRPDGPHGQNRQGPQERPNQRDRHDHRDRAQPPMHQRPAPDPTHAEFAAAVTATTRNAVDWTPEAAAQESARRERQSLLRTFEGSTLTKSNFLVLKRMQEADLDAQLALARQERQQMRALEPPAPPREQVWEGRRDGHRDGHRGGQRDERRDPPRDGRRDGPRTGPRDPSRDASRDGPRHTPAPQPGPANTPRNERSEVRSEQPPQGATGSDQPAP